MIIINERMPYGNASYDKVSVLSELVIRKTLVGVIHCGWRVIIIAILCNYQDVEIKVETPVDEGTKVGNLPHPDMPIVEDTKEM